MHLVRRISVMVIVMMAALVIAPVQPHSLASSHSCFVYVANASSNNVKVIGTATNSVISTIPVGMLPEGVAITPDGTKLYVTNAGSDTVSVINTTTNTTTSAITVGNVPYGIAITPNGTKAYVTNESDDTVSVIDTATNTATTFAIAVGNNPYGIAISPDGTKAYVTNDGDDTVSVIDTATNTTSVIAVGDHPSSIAVRCVVASISPAPAPIVSLHHSSLDPNGGTCVTNGIATTTSARTPFLGYSYIPGAEECTRIGFTFQGWAATTKPDTVIPLPLLRGWDDGIWRYFIANSYDLIAVWKSST